MEKYITSKSKELYEENKKYVTDGVGSYFHRAGYQDYPIAMTHGKGSKLYDVDGNEYIDYIAGFGPMLLGHCPKTVEEAVEKQLKRGTHFSAPTKELGELGKRLTEIIPSAEQVCFQNSGTEVVMYALRLARAYTGKYKIVKFEGQYHGWSDEGENQYQRQLCGRAWRQGTSEQDYPHKGAETILSRRPDSPSVE